MRYRWLCRKIFLILTVIFCLFFIFRDTDHGLKDNEDDEYADNFDAEKDEEFVKEYLKSMQKGTAYVRPIYEKEKMVEENYWCFLNRPDQMENSQKWTRMAGIDVFSAYYDDRPNSLFPSNNAIQVLAMSNHSIEGVITVYCNIFEYDSSYAIVKGYIREIWQKGWDPRDTFQVPSLITCPIPKRIDHPKSQFVVSLSRKNCFSKNVGIKVEMGENKKEKKDVAVCVKALDYQEDISGRLLEWIEMQLFFGADTISIYSHYLTNQTNNVLQYYKNSGKISWIPLELPPGNPNESAERSEFIKKDRAQKRRHELLPYNDCFYRYIHSHNYILILDIDEIIVPIQFDNYGSLLRHVENRTAPLQLSSISARNVFKFRSNFSIIPQYSYMMSNRKRSRKTSKLGEYGKSFVSTSSVATVFNHFALHKLSRQVSKSTYLAPSEAIKLHYKSECPWESRNECHVLQYDLTDDTSLDKHERSIRKRVEMAVDQIGGF